MPANVFKIENGKFGLTSTAPSAVAVCSAVITPYTDFTCQITSGALVANPNVSDNTTPATWCQAESTAPLVGQTSFELQITFLQDPNIVAGLSRYLYEHDTEIAYFFMGLDGTNPPKATGALRVVAGMFGGDARVALTADITLPCEAKPQVCFGNSTASAGVGGAASTSATAGIPGTWSPAGSTPPANFTAANTAGITASPTSNWTVGQYMQGSTAGTGGEMNWNGTAWVTGKHA